MYVCAIVNSTVFIVMLLFYSLLLSLSLSLPSLPPFLPPSSLPPPLPQELKVSNCLNICDSGVQAISLNCPRLSILVCHGCPLLTSNSREVIVGMGEGDGKGPARRGLKQITWTVY